MSDLPLAFVVMLTHDGSRQLSYSLPSLRQTDYPNMRVVLIDNASSEDVCSIARTLYPEAHVVRSKKNLWWAGGNNLGVELSLSRGAEYVCLVNDDLLFDRRWLCEAIRVGERVPDVGIIGFEMFDSRVQESREAFDRAVTVWDVVRVEQTTNVSGAAMLVKRRVFQDVGLFDPVYLAYCEENDFEARAILAGYRMVQVNVPIWHQSGASFDRVPLRRSYLSMRNIIRYGIKNRTVAYTLRTAAHVLRVAANPFVDVSRLDVVDQRYRPGSLLTNASLALLALGWNVVHLPQTLRQRRLDRKRIAEGADACASR